MSRIIKKRPSDPRSNEAMAMNDLLEFIFESDEPISKAYRQRKARQSAPRTEGLHANTHLCIDLKTLLQHDRRMLPGKCYRGVLRLQETVDEYRCDELVVFIEGAAQTIKRNPRVYDGKYVTITQREDGSYRANLKPIAITDGFDIIGYATEVGNELLWALEGLRRK